MVTRREEGINWEIGIDIYTLLYIKWASRCLIGKESSLPSRCESDPCVRKIPWRRKWQPTLEFLTGESHAQRSLAGSTGLQKAGHD